MDSAAIQEIAELRGQIRSLIRHVDEMAHTCHRAYHGGHPGYFYCPMPYCVSSAAIVRKTEMD